MRQIMDTREPMWMRYILYNSECMWMHNMVYVKHSLQRLVFVSRGNFRERTGTICPRSYWKIAVNLWRCVVGVIYCLMVLEFTAAHAHTHTHIQTHVHIHIHIHTHIHTHIYTLTHAIYIYTCLHTWGVYCDAYVYNWTPNRQTALKVARRPTWASSTHRTLI